MEELVAQGVVADRVVFASSSGGTHAGLALGAAATGFAGQVYGISVDEPQSVLQERSACRSALGRRTSSRTRTTSAGGMR
jgi:D-cysteine desulfhydrase